MAELKLPRLPDRTPVKLTIVVTPELADRLAFYTGLYEAAYGQREATSDLIPSMLDRFLESDREFMRQWKGRTPAA